MHRRQDLEDAAGQLDEPFSVGAREQAARAGTRAGKRAGNEEGDASTVVRSPLAREGSAREGSAREGAAREHLQTDVPTSGLADRSKRAEEPRASTHADAERARASMPNGRLGNYQLIASLGRGGMAEVMLALVSAPAGFPKLTVLKILREDVQASSDDAVPSFLAEARLAARFSHPNVVRTHEAAQLDHRYLLAMEYLEGQTYRHAQRRAAKTCGLLLHEHLRILSQVARGLHYVHTLADDDGQPLSMVHRDVSPQNVFVTYDGEVKLLDFGIAQTRETEQHALDRVIKGKLDYMAPEQLKREEVSARADVFALGAMLWEAISGARFAGGRAVSDYAKAQARVQGGEPNIRVVQPGVPEALAQLVDHALALDPEQRLPDAAGFADALDSYLLAVGASTYNSLPGLMSSLFERDRRKLRALIERHLTRVKSEQDEVEASSAERACFPVAEVETSRWTAARDLSGPSSLHLTLDGGAQQPPASSHDSLAEADLDEPTLPRISADLCTRALDPGGSADAPGSGRVASVLRTGSEAPHASTLRGTGRFERASLRSRATTAVLLAFGALSGGALAWFGPASGADSSTGTADVLVLPEQSGSPAVASDTPRIDLPVPTLGQSDLGRRAEETQRSTPTNEDDLPPSPGSSSPPAPEPVVGGRSADPSPLELAPAAASSPSVVLVEPRPDEVADAPGIAVPTAAPTPAILTAAPLRALRAADGRVAQQPVVTAAKRAAVPPLARGASARFGSPLARGASARFGAPLARGASARFDLKKRQPPRRATARAKAVAPRAPIPFKATVERNPYLR